MKPLHLLGKWAQAKSWKLLIVGVALSPIFILNPIAALTVIGIVNLPLLSRSLFGLAEMMEIMESPHQAPSLKHSKTARKMHRKYVEEYGLNSKIQSVSHSGVFVASADFKKRNLGAPQSVAIGRTAPSLPQLSLDYSSSSVIPSSLPYVRLVAPPSKRVQVSAEEREF